MTKLASCTESNVAGIKYFSGTATYAITLDAPRQWFRSGTRQWLDREDVKDLAEVIINGKHLGVLRRAPFQVDVTHAANLGDNQLIVKVTNTWVNLLIGGQQRNAKVDYTFTEVTPYKANSPLLPSGLIGPGRLFAATKP